MNAFEKQLRELNDFDPRGAGVLSLYLHTDPRTYDYSALLHQVERVASALREGMDPAQWSALDDELIAVRDFVGSMLSPAPGMVIFTCTPRHFFRVVRLPAALAPAAYWATWPHIVALLDAVERAGLKDADLLALPLP